MPQKTINLGLQGGGAHGAFTWGALDYLLEDGRLSFKTISGTSAGSMNAVVMVDGLIRGGADAARAHLENFWRKVSEAGPASKAQSRFTPWMGPFTEMMNSSVQAGFDMMARVLSPYQFNPLGLNPLKDILLDTVDFTALRKSTDYNLFIAATDVLSSKLKTFSGTALSVEAVLASACLPQLFQAVEINGRFYWDGGYMGNPTLFPLTKCMATQDVLIVQIDPITREEVPRSAGAIADRLNEISFNSPLLVELRGIHLINQLLEAGHLNAAQCGLRALHIHIVSDDKTMAALALDTKFNPEWHFLLALRDAGRVAAKKWLAAHYDAVGARSSVDLSKI